MVLNNVGHAERGGDAGDRGIGNGGILRGRNLLRGELLESGRAKEAALTEDDLRRTKALFVGNSLRGLIRVRLA